MFHYSPTGNGPVAIPMRGEAASSSSLHALLLLRTCMRLGATYMRVREHMERPAPASALATQAAASCAALACMHVGPVGSSCLYAVSFTCVDSPAPAACTPCPLCAWDSPPSAAPCAPCSAPSRPPETPRAVLPASTACHPWVPPCSSSIPKFHSNSSRLSFIQTDL